MSDESVDEIADMLESELQTVHPAQHSLSHHVLPSSHDDYSETQSLVVMLDLQCRQSPCSDTDTCDVRASPSSDTASHDPDQMKLLDTDTKAVNSRRTPLPVTVQTRRSSLRSSTSAEVTPEFNTNSTASVAEVKPLMVLSTKLDLRAARDMSEDAGQPASVAMTYSAASEALACQLTATSEAVISTVSAAVTDAVLLEAVSRRLSSETVTNSAASLKFKTSSTTSESVTSCAAVHEPMQNSAGLSDSLTESSVKSTITGREETLTTVEQHEHCTTSSNVVPTSIVKLELPEHELTAMTVAPCVPCTVPSDGSEHSSATSELSITELSLSAIEHRGSTGSVECVVLPVAVKSEPAWCHSTVDECSGEDLSADVKPEAVKLDRPWPQNSELGVVAATSEYMVVTSDGSVVGSRAVTSDPGTGSSNILTHESSLMTSLSRTVTLASSCVKSTSSILASVSASSTVTLPSTTLMYVVTSAPGNVPCRVTTCVVAPLPNAVTTTVSIGQNAMTQVSSCMGSQSQNITNVPYIATNMSLCHGGMTVSSAVTSSSSRDVSDTTASIVHMSELLDYAAGSAPCNVALAFSDYCRKPHTKLEVSSASIITDGIPSSSVHASMHHALLSTCLLYTSPSPRDRTRSRMPSSA